MKISKNEIRKMIAEEIKKIFSESKDYTKYFDFSNVSKDELIVDFEKLGYFLGCDGIQSPQGIEMIVLQFEPLYQDEVTEEDLCGSELVHITSYYNVADIKMNGSPDADIVKLGDKIE